MRGVLVTINGVLHVGTVKGRGRLSGVVGSLMKILTMARGLVGHFLGVRAAPFRLGLCGERAVRGGYGVVTIYMLTRGHYLVYCLRSIL